MACSWAEHWRRYVQDGFLIVAGERNISALSLCATDADLAVSRDYPSPDQCPVFGRPTPYSYAVSPLLLPLLCPSLKSACGDLRCWIRSGMIGRYRCSLGYCQVLDSVLTTCFLRLETSLGFCLTHRSSGNSYRGIIDVGLKAHVSRPRELTQLNPTLLSSIAHIKLQKQRLCA